MDAYFPFQAVGNLSKLAKLMTLFSNARGFIY